MKKTAFKKILLLSKEVSLKLVSFRQVFFLGSDANFSGIRFRGGVEGGRRGALGVFNLRHFGKKNAKSAACSTQSHNSAAAALSR